MSPLNRIGPTLNPSGTLSRVDTQQTTAANAGNQYNVAPQILWGIYGTETDFGNDVATSSAGAQGPMQFEPATWAKYGGGKNINNYEAAMYAAAKYLHDLGADTNPTSSATIAAVNAYNGNGGGSNPNTSYFQSVLSKGAQMKYGGPNAVTGSSVSQAQSSNGSSDGSGFGSLAGAVEDIATGDIGGLAATLGLGIAVGIKDMAVGAWNLVVVPLWHRNQDAVWWYSSNVLFPTTGNVGAEGTYKPYQTWPVNAVFWGFGYALLFTDPSAPAGSRLTPADPRRSRVARHVRRLQAAPAKRSLIKPGDVKKHTPKKPKEVRSRVHVQSVGQLSTSRARAVRVTGTLAGNSTPVRSVDSGDRRREQTAPRSVESGVRVSEVQERIRARAAQAARPAAKPHAQHSGGQRPSAGRRVRPVTPAGQRTRGGRSS